MGKTNEERAECTLNKYWFRAEANFQDAIDDIATILDKAEKRGRRKAAAIFAENTALKAQVACLKYGSPLRAENAGCTVQFVTPQPPFDAEKVKLYIETIWDSIFEACKYPEGTQQHEGYRKYAEEARDALTTELGIDD